MQIKALNHGIYKLAGYAYRHQVKEKPETGYSNPVNQWKKLKLAGVSDAVCSEIVGISRATYYRYCQRIAALSKGIKLPTRKPKKLNKACWGESQKQRVLEVRRENPTYGKEKITVILKRDFGLEISVSTVGRILKHLFEKALIQKSSSAPRQRRKRNFKKGHAKAHPFKPYKDMTLGEFVQVDHMSVTKNGISVKHFQAWERHSKHVHAGIYGNATSLCAKKFLEQFLAEAPYPIQSIQVDGGSEFMAEFETACEARKIPLYVLPPRRPKYNGGVERTNRTFREEFYDSNRLQADSIGAMRCELKQALKKYNEYRPHQGLQGLTPMAYIQQTTSAVLSQNA